MFYNRGAKRREESNNTLTLYNRRLVKKGQFASCFFILFGIFSIFSCKQHEPPVEENNILRVENELPPSSVQVCQVEARGFKMRFHATGILDAKRKVDVSLPRSGLLLCVPETEGQWVSEGQRIAQLDTTLLHLEWEQAILSLNEAEVNKKDLLIANGGNADVDTSVSPQKLKLILTLSGYDKALHAIRLADYELVNSTVFAPFEGRIVNIKANAGEQSAAGKVICTLFDPYSFETVFSLLQHEATNLNLGQDIQVYPLALPSTQLGGQVTAINPVVDESGLIRVHAKIIGDRERIEQLFLGMHVKIVIEKVVPGQLVLPKKAVIDRSGRSIVFTLDKEENRAKWNEVVLAYENDIEVAISKGLKAKELAICEGNFNLNHDTPVQIQDAE